LGEKGEFRTGVNGLERGSSGRVFFYVRKISLTRTTGKRTNSTKQRGRGGNTTTGGRSNSNALYKD